MALKYTLTLSTIIDPGRPAAAQTTWTLTTGEADELIAKGGGTGDPHGDHARLDGRAAAHKHALSIGLRIVPKDVRVVYARPAAPATPTPTPTPTPTQTPSA